MTGFKSYTCVFFSTEINVSRWPNYIFRLVIIKVLLSGKRWQGTNWENSPFGGELPM